MADNKQLSAVEEAAQSKAALYRIGAQLIQWRIPVLIITGIFTGFMAYKMLGMQMSYGLQ